MSEENKESTTLAKPKKPKGPIRWEAILPTSILIVIIYLYFTLLFDQNLKSLLEFAGYKAVGAEVNIGQIKTSFLKASVQIKKIEVTDKEKPQHNSIELGEINFGMSWDALLRAKILINEASVLQVSYGTQRKHPGKIAPPEPIEPESNEPSLIDKVTTDAVNKVEEQNSNNVIGDLAAILSGSNGGAQLDNLKGSLESKKIADALSSSLAEKEKKWNSKSNELPKEKDFQALSARAGKVKIKDFKSVDELQLSLKELESIGKEFDSNFQVYSKIQTDLATDLNLIKEQTTQLDLQIKKDIVSLENHFQIPKIDAKSLTMSVFGQYLTPYQQKFSHYQGLAKKYLPPNLLKKDKSASKSEEENLVQVRPMAKGKSYEFEKKNSYPLFWIKKIAVSSKAGVTPDSGDISGEITDITSNQKNIGKTTIAHFAGDFPSKNIHGIDFTLDVNNLNVDSLITVSFIISRFNLQNKEITGSDDLTISLEDSTSKIKILSTLEGLKKLKFNYYQELSNSKFKVDSKNTELGQSLNSVFSSLPNINLTSSAEGNLPKINLNIESNFGSEFEKAIKQQISQKIEELKSKLQAAVDKEVGNQKNEINKQINDFKAKYESQLAAVKASIEKEKKNIETKSNSAKKELENKTKNQIETEGKKAVEDLKKKFGF